MKNKILYLACIGLIAGAAAFAQSSSTDTQSGSTATTPQISGHTNNKGDLPAPKEDEQQGGKSSTANSSDERPGSMGAPETQNTGTSPKGETPATGAQTEKKGTSDNNDTRPGTTPTTTPKQGGTDSGSEVPK